jgi:hypothetical protein
MKYTIFIFTFITIFASCKNDTGFTSGPKPPAMGVINEVVIIADDELYDGAIGDTLHYYFSSAYPMMPSPEPIFDIRHFTINDLFVEPLRKELRTYLVVADISDSESETTKLIRKDLGEDRFQKALNSKVGSSTIGKDKWANGQLIFYIFGNGPEVLSKAIKENFGAIASKVNDHDNSILSANLYAAKRTNKGLIDKVQESFGLHIPIPGDFVLVKEDVQNDFLWLRKDAKDGILNVAIHAKPYTSESQFSKDSIIAFRDEYGKKYVSSDREGSYMVTNQKDLPIMSYDIKLDGNYAKEIRGIWEMENDFKGGPYFSYAIPVLSLNKVIYIDAMVLAPGKDKRDMMQQLDYIVKQTKLLAFAND